MGNGMRIDPRSLPFLMQLQIAMQLVKQQEEKTAKGGAGNDVLQPKGIR